MKKSGIIIVAALFQIVVGLGVLTLTLIGVISWVWGGVRLTSERAVEAVGLGTSQNRYIDAENCRFYIQTLSDCYEMGEEEETADAICRVMPTVRNRLGLWYAIPNPSSRRVLLEENGTDVGRLVTVEVDGVFHHFLLLAHDGNDSLSLPDFIVCGVEKLFADGEVASVIGHSYFTSAKEPNRLVVNGVSLTVKP